MLSIFGIQSAFENAGLKASEVKLSRGETLFRWGDPVRKMYLVERGSLVMVRTLENGQELVVQRAGPGDLFAEASLFSDQYYCDAICGTAVVCAVYDKQDILNALTNPDLSIPILRAYSLQIRDLHTQIELRNIRRADERLLAYFNTLPVDDEGWHEPEHSWKDISRTIGITHEACYRTLAALERSGRIERSGGRYRLRNQAAVKATR
ncbi:Crp/Fnr family transcriptional regulator [Rhodobacterales bacterium]|nr:Crp/Fnr family transcriptional regulator [Rhodobacterales bacterium]